MLGLPPKATKLSKALPKKAIFDKFKPSPADRRLFDEQINRLSIVAEISPDTVMLPASEEVLAVYVILVVLKTHDCDKKNIVLLSKLINQRMLFVLQWEDHARLAVYRSGKVLISEEKQLADWKLNLSGLNLEAVWENTIAQIGGIDITGGKDLDAIIAEHDLREKLIKQIATLEKQARAERQPRTKWDLVQKIKQLKIELGRDPQ